MSNSDWVSPARRPRITRTITPTASWGAVDLAEVLDGDHVHLAPTVAAREDGKHLLYAGKIHTLSSEPEAGKTWLALHWAAQQLLAGQPVVYIDYEDDAPSVVGRLLALGVSRDVIIQGFIYVRPDTRLRAVDRDQLVSMIHDRGVGLVVIDGVTEALTVEGKSLVDNADVAEFFNSLPKPLANTGAAVLMLDHEVKSVQERGRYALGAGHKLAAVSGAAYKLKSVTPFSISSTGSSHLIVVKDRPGQVRPLALDDKGLIAEVVVTGVSASRTAISLSTRPGRAARRDAMVRLERKVLEAISASQEPLTTKGAVKTLVRGNSSNVGTALNNLIEAGRVVMREGRYRVVDDATAALE